MTLKFFPMRKSRDFIFIFYLLFFHFDWWLLVCFVCLFDSCLIIWSRNRWIKSKLSMHYSFSLKMTNIVSYRKWLWSISKYYFEISTLKLFDFGIFFKKLILRDFWLLVCLSVCLLVGLLSVTTITQSLIKLQIIHKYFLFFPILFPTFLGLKRVCLFQEYLCFFFFSKFLSIQLRVFFWVSNCIFNKWLPDYPYCSVNSTP